MTSQFTLSIALLLMIATVPAQDTQSDPVSVSRASDVAKADPEARAFEALGATDDLIAALVERGGVHHLDLSWSRKLTAKGLAQVAELNALHTLRLTGCAHFSDHDLRPLIAIGTLKHLDITMCPAISDRLMVPLIKANPIEVLRVGGTASAASAVGDKSAIALAKAKTLIEGRFARASFSPRGMKALCSIPTLQKLTLSDVELPSAALSGLRRAKQLEELELTRVEFGAKHLRAVIKAPSLKALLLGGENRLKPNELGLLRGAKKLERLVLGPGQATSDSGLDALAKLRRLKALQISGRGARLSSARLARLGNQDGLAELSLSGVVLDEDFAMVLEHHAQLRELSFVEVQGITPKGLTPVAALGNLEALKVMWCPGIDDACLSPLSGLPALKALDVSGLEHLTSKFLLGLHACSQLESVVLPSLFRRDRAAIAALQRALPSLKVELE